MSPFLRAVHLCSHCYQKSETQNTQPATRILFLFVSYLFLLTFIYLFLKKCIQAQTQRYDITPLPSADLLGYIYGIVVIIMGGVGLYCVIEDEWTTVGWVYYFFSNTFIGVFIAVYQTNKSYTLFATVLIGIILCVFLQLLFMESAQMDKGKQTLIIRNLLGAVQSWAIVSTLLTLGQWAVHNLQMSKSCQTALFFIFTPFSIILISQWNRREGYSKWDKLYGFCLSAAILVQISLIRTFDREDQE